MFAGAGDADHKRLAVTAIELASQKIVGAVPLPALRIFLCFQSLLHGVKHLLGDDRRDAVFSNNARVTVGANVVIVLQEPVKTALVPWISQTCPQTSAVQIGGDAGECLLVQEPFEYLPDDCCRCFVDCIIASDILIAERQSTIDLAISGVVCHTTANVLGHVLGIKLVDVHHGTQSEPACGCVAEFLFCVEGADPIGFQPVLVAERIEHITCDTV